MPPHVDLFFVAVCCIRGVFFNHDSAIPKSQASRISCAKKMCKASHSEKTEKNVAALDGF